MSSPTVAEYAIARLAKLGISDCFGVPGDYAFPINDAIVSNESIRWRGCSNELNASYAADGYARIRGAAMLNTTYAVGELSALCGVMGAKAERSTIFHLVGMSSMRQQILRRAVHHTFGDGVFQNFINISAQAACVSAILTPDNCVYEMERVVDADEEPHLTTLARRFGASRRQDRIQELLAQRGTDGVRIISLGIL